MMKKFLNNLASTGRRLQLTNIPWGVLSILVGMALVSFIWSIVQTGDWAGAAMNFSTEMAGAVVTYFLLEIVLGTRQTKERLIVQMGSSIRDIAIPALEELSRLGWLFDGTLKNANLQGANLEDANLEKANLEGVNFFEANLKGANLSQANMQRASLRGTVLENANLWQADITGADFEMANLMNAFLNNLELGGANFYHASLEGADLVGTNLKDAMLFASNLKLAKYGYQTTWPDDFDPKEQGAIDVTEDIPLEDRM